MQATGGEKPLAWSTGDLKLLVWAAGGWAPLVWAKGSGRLRVMWCLLPYLQVAGMDLGGSLEARGRRGLLPLGAFEQLHLWPQSLQGSSNQKQKKKKKEGTATKHHMLLSLPWEHTYPAAATAKHSRQHSDI